MKSITPLLLATTFVILSCNNSTQKPGNVYQPDIEEAVGYVIPADSLEPPMVVKAGKPKIVRAGKPNVTYVNSNVVPAGQPDIFPAGDLVVTTPGENGYSLPDTAIAKHHPVLAEPPEMVTAKDPGTKDKNPQHFSFYGKLQGMQSNGFMSITEDGDGNLWFGSIGDGVTKYDGNTFYHYKNKEDVSQNFISQLFIDHRSDIWMGTMLGGLIHFDGRYFTNYSWEDGLSNNWITGLLEDSGGNLWISTLQGLNVFDGKNFIHFATKQGLPGDSIGAIVRDGKGNIWISTNHGIVKYDGERFYSYKNINRLIKSSYINLYCDPDNNLWIGYANGLLKYDGQNFYCYDNRDGLLAAGDIATILMDKDGILWIGYYQGGLTKFDGKTFVHFTEKEGLAGTEIRAVYEDKSGNMWIATNGNGMYRFGGKTSTHFSQNEGLQSDIISGIVQDKNEDLWMSSWHGLIKYDGESFSNLSDAQGLGQSLAWNIIQDTKQRLWLTTINGISIFDGNTFSNYTTEEGLLYSDNHCVLEDSKGNFWIGSVLGLTKYDGKTFTHYTEKSGLGSNIMMVKCLMKDRDGNIWIGTGAGVKKFDKGVFKHYTVKKNSTYNTVLSMLQDYKGNIWLGTVGGLVRYDGKFFWRFGEKEGIANNSIESILEDDSIYWFGGENGLSKLEKSRFASFEKNHHFNADSASRLFQTYTNEDGLTGVGPIFKRNDGTLWMGAQGLTTFYTNAVKTDTNAPVLRLTNISLFNGQIDWQNFKSGEARSDTTIVMGNGETVHDIYFDSTSRWYGIPQNLSLPHDNNDITIKYAGITMKSPKKVQYKYMLEGMDKQWNVSTSRTEVTYGNLPHGNYVFKVKAVNTDGYWSNEIHYPFTIRPPWWRTWWAYTVFSLAFAGTMYALFRYRLNQVRREHELKHKTAALEMKALRAQMNPHFIFNSLNSINLFIMENNRLQASEYLAIFSKLVRLILNNSRETFIPLSQELEALQLYLELESLRFENKFNYSINVDENVDADNIKVPPLIIQPYVENAIWHGLMPKKEQGKLEITLHMRSKLLHCKIIDDGIGRKKAAEFRSKATSAGKSMGMRITSDRIAILQDQRDNDGHILITDIVLPDGSAGGTEVLIKIPVNYH